MTNIAKLNKDGGLNEGIWSQIENNVAQGEDRDGDGKIDPKPERGQRGGGRPPRR